MGSEHSQFIRNISPGQRLTYGFHQVLDHFFGRRNLFDDRTRYFEQLERTMSAKGEGRIRPIERRKDLSVTEFKSHYLRKGIPVVMEGAAKEWPCVNKWSLQYFKNLHGRDEIVLVDLNKQGFPYELTTLSDVIDDIGGNGSKYYRFYPLLVRHPEHIEDFDYKWLRARTTKLTWFDAFQVFIGGKGAYTSLHNANQSNLFVQVYGQKEWVLYSHYYSPVVDPSPVRNVYRTAQPGPGCGPFNPFQSDFDPHFRLYKYLDGYSVHLNPGDVLWNPPFYWHAVRNLSDSIGVGYRWLAPFYSFKVSPLFMALDCFATQPPIWKAYSLYRKDMNEVFLAEMKNLEEAKQKIAEREITRTTPVA